MRTVWCSSVIANEELIMKLLVLVDPVFGYSMMSHVPSEFLSLETTYLMKFEERVRLG